MIDINGGFQSAGGLSCEGAGYSRTEDISGISDHSRRACQGSDMKVECAEGGEGSQGWGDNVWSVGENASCVDSETCDKWFEVSTLRKTATCHG